MLLFISTRHAFKMRTQTSTPEQSELIPPVSEKGAHKKKNRAEECEQYELGEFYVSI